MFNETSVSSLPVILDDVFVGVHMTVQNLLNVREAGGSQPQGDLMTLRYSK